MWGVLIALGLTLVLLMLEPPTYRSDATVFVRTPGDVSRVVDGGDTYAQGRAKTYTALATSSTVSDWVIKDLGLNEQAGTLAGRIKASNPPGTALIHISVDSPSAAEAQQIATVFLAEYRAMVHDLESVPGSLVPRAELIVVDTPSRGVREVAWGLPVAIVLVSVAVVGLILGAAAAVLRSVFETGRRLSGAADSIPELDARKVNS
ncbi:cell shape-determining protein [Mycolicibacterium agri]|nr:cell shape-determining protein [Mycolicibacterium agri]